MTPRGRFSYSDTETYCNDKAYLMTGSSLKYLCALLNSSLITWMMKGAALTTGMGLPQWKKFTVERVPVPRISAHQQRPLIQFVDEIRKVKDVDPYADTSELEWRIDQLVYDLYRLDEQESSAIRRAMGLGRWTDRA